jgi:hypothetical protein
MKRNFQIECGGKWHQVLTDMVKWYVVSEQGNREFESLLDLPKDWQKLMVGLADQSTTPAELAANAGELHVVLSILHGTKVHIDEDGMPRIDGMPVFARY